MHKTFQFVYQVVGREIKNERKSNFKTQKFTSIDAHRIGNPEDIYLSQDKTRADLKMKRRGKSSNEKRRRKVERRRLRL